MRPSRKWASLKLITVNTSIWPLGRRIHRGRAARFSPAGSPLSSLPESFRHIGLRVFALALAPVLLTSAIRCAAQTDMAMTAPPDAPMAAPSGHGDVPANECTVRDEEPLAPGIEGPAPLLAEASYTPGPASAEPPKSMTCPRHANWYDRFVNGPKATPMTPEEKGWLALRNLFDPFSNFVLVAGAAYSVSTDARSPYGPGMHGFARNVRVGFTESMTGEFVNTFMIPSLVHQDPHYHRMPGKSVERRVGHVLLQTVWTQSDHGRGMLNYSNLAGCAIDGEVANLYVPGRETNLRASAERYGAGLASAPLDNFVTEFLPDVARRIHLRTVIVERIVNHVANINTTASPQ